MFLVSAQSQQTIEPVRRSIRDVVVRHPVRLRVQHWELRPSDMWYVRGNGLVLQVLSDLLRDPPADAVEDTDEEPQANILSSRMFIVHAEAAPPRPKTFWQRLFRRREAEGETLTADATALIETWYADGIGPGDTLERRVVERIALAVTAGYDVLVLDRVQRFMRPQVRFRVSAALRELCCSQGITLVALSEHAPDSWIAIDRRAWIRRGVFELVQRLTDESGE